ncbi:hypothetical protein JL720_830 [Aureococcus anophagefferens]|nr:hypothetical protein JL720_830 [Aureococcus anophagefferens]
MTARLLVLSALCAVADGEAIRQDCGTVAVSTDAVALILRGEAFRGLPGVEAQIADPLAVAQTHVKNVVEPLEKRGVRVDVFLVGSGCRGAPGVANGTARTYWDALADAYGARRVKYARDASGPFGRARPRKARSALAGAGGAATGGARPGPGSLGHVPPVRETLTRASSARRVRLHGQALSGYRAAKKELRRGDTAIFIGVLWQPFAADCERRDYACVHYVTEPKGRDAHDKSKRPPPGIRELWTYTRAHDWARSTTACARPGASPSRASSGSARPGASRARAGTRFAAKNPKTRGKAESRRDVWSPTAWKRAKRVDDTAFLNMHKAPGSGRAARRAPLALLSLGAVVVSEPALAADRAEFAGMLLEEADFCDGRGWTEATKERLFDGGAAALARWRREAYAAYKAKFDPEAILRRAGVWSL